MVNAPPLKLPCHSKESIMDRILIIEDQIDIAELQQDYQNAE